MQSNIVFILVWLVCGAVTVIAAALAGRSRQARDPGSRDEYRQTRQKLTCSAADPVERSEEQWTAEGGG